MSYGYNTGERNRVALASDEEILWQGKPKKSAFIATKSLTMLPIALIWLILDLGFIVPALGSGEMLYFIIPFFALHMMPVWIWLANVFTAGRRYINTNYYVTNRRIIIQHGFFAVNEISLFYKDLKNAQVRIGLIDKFFNVGDIYFDTGFYTGKNNQNQYVFEELENPQETYVRIQRIILDIQTDIEYPNAMRPSENPGYKTDYRP